MSSSLRSRTGRTVTLVPAALAPGLQLPEGDGAAGVLDLDHRAVGSGVGVDDHLPRGPSPPFPRRPAAIARRMSSGSSRVELGGTGGDEVVEGEGVGEVEVGVDVHEPVGGHLVQVHVEVPLLRGRYPSGLGLGGVELGAGGVDGAFDLGERAAVQHRREVPVHIPGRIQGQGPGLLGDLAGLPHHHLTGQDPCPGAWEPVAQLDRVPDIGDALVGGVPDRERELRDRELAHRRRTGPGDLEIPVSPRDGLIDRFAGVQLAPTPRPG